MEPFDRDPHTPGQGRPDDTMPAPSDRPWPAPAAPPPSGAWPAAGLPPGIYGASAPMPLPWNAPASPPWWHRVAGMAVSLLVLGVIVAVRLAARDNTDSTTPAQWDERVLPITTFVAETRELEWVHPVAVDFLPEAEFVALFGGPETDTTVPGLDALTRRANEQRSAVYNAKGLTVSYDPDAADTTVQEITTLGFYSPSIDRISMRGNELTPAVRVVLAHELTHALQAQHFDLTAERPNDLEFRAVVEADALRVENVYRDTLSPAEQEQADSGNTLTEDAQTELDEVPWALIEESYAPYVIGPNLIDTVFAERGNEGVNRLISAPPTEEILLSPWLFGTEQPRPTIILVAPADSTSIDDLQLMSPVEMLIMLDAWLPFGEARAALDGWGNGSYTAYETASGPICFTVKAAFDDKAAATVFRDTVTRWGAAMGSSLSPSLTDETVEFEACDRGADAPPTPDPVIAPLLALTIELDAIGLAGPDPTPEQIADYRCFAATLIDDPAAAPLLASREEFTAEQDATFNALTDAAASACGVPPLER